jgi:hypothetical protein
MAASSRPPGFGAGPAAASDRRANNFADVDGEKTTVDPEPPSAMAEKMRALVDEDCDTANSGMSEVTLEESRRGLKRNNPASQSNPAAAGTLVIIAGNDRGKTFDLTGRRVSLGRGIDNDIILTDLAVSRQHLALDFDGKSYYARDLGSGNGTLINDFEQREKCLVNDGDRMEIGNTIVRIDLPNQAVDDESPTRRPPVQKTMDVDADDIAFDEEESTVAGRASQSRHSPKPGVGLPRPPAPSVAKPPINWPPAQSPARESAPPPMPPPKASPPKLLRRTPLNTDEKITVPRPAQSPPAQPASEALPIAGKNVHLGEPRLPAAKQPIGRMTVPGPAPAPANLASEGVASLSPRPRKPTAPVVYSGNDRLPASPQGVARLPLGVLQPRTNNRKKLFLIGGGAAVTVALALGLVFGIGVGKDKAEDDVNLVGSQDSDKSDDKDKVVTDDKSDDKDKVVTGDDKSDDKDKVVAPEVTVPDTVWGTREGQLLASLGGAIQVAPLQPDPAEKEAAEKEAAEKEAAEKEAAEKEAAEKERAEKERAEKERSAKKPPPKKPPPKKPPPKKPPTPPPPVTKVADSSAARKKAASQYRGGNPADAAATLRAAAKSSNRSEAKKLNSLASKYSNLAANLAKGKSNRTSNPSAAASAFQKALSTDKGLGGANQKTIAANLRFVAPKAARSALASKNFFAAKRFADLAKRLGQESKVRAVRSSLSREAQRLFRAAVAAFKKKDKKGARSMLKKITRIVPPSDTYYKKAKEALRKF